MQFYLFNICHKLRHTVPNCLNSQVSTSPAACWCCCSSNLYLENCRAL